MRTPHQCQILTVSDARNGVCFGDEQEVEGLCFRALLIELTQYQQMAS